jgi:hypothetical protein
LEINKLYFLKKKFYLLLFFLGVLFTFCRGQNVYTLKNQSLEFAIDEKGNLQTLKNINTGFNYASGGPLWRLYFDNNNEKDIEISANNNNPAIQRSGDEIIITYKDLTVRNREIDFKLTLRIKLEENLLRFSSEIFNNELHTVIRELQYPLLADCKLPPDHRLLTTQRGGNIYPDVKKQILSLPHTYMGPDHKLRSMNFSYPADVSANCFALTGISQGLYFGSHDSTFEDTGHGFKLYPDEQGDFDQLEIGLYKFPNCLSGNRWINNSNVIAPYSGSWHETSKIYRRWADTWWEHREPPMWVKQMPGFQRIILRHQYGETIFPYKDFGTRVKDAGESVGINTVFPFGWWQTGMDNGYPDSYYTTFQDQGGDQAWKKAIFDYQDGGGKVIMYFNGKLIDTESDYYKNGEGKEVCFKTNTGTEYTEAYRFTGAGMFTGYCNFRSFVVADTRNPKWHTKLKEMADWAYELGSDCVFYDQLGYAEKSWNWDLNQEFPVPHMRIIADKAKALKMIHDYIDSKYPANFAIGTEHICDVTSQYVDFVHGIFHTGSWYIKEHTNFVDWFRYTFPEIIITDRDIDGDEPNIESLTNRSALLGLRTNVQTYRLRALINETPRYQEYLAKVNRLKEKYSSFLLLGTYRDTEGFEMDNPEIEGRNYINDNQMAVVLTQSVSDKAITRLFVPGYEYQESAGVGKFTVLSGNNGIPNITIGRDGLVVLRYDKK